MSTITKEQAKDLRNAFECWQQDYDPVDDKEQYDMFGLGMVAMDALLASLEAEAVMNEIVIPEPATHRNINEICPPGVNQTLFASGWNASRKSGMNSGRIPPIVKGIDAECMGWNACRAAMRQGADQATIKQPSSNSVLGWLRADYQEDNRGLRGNAPLFVLGKKDPSTVWGLDYIPLTSNSPVIQDGWVACSERLPEETKDPDGAATGYLVLYAEGKEPNGGFSVGVWNVTYLRQWWRGFITHWMPLPAAPQQEV
ncbi:DUF551 domain-containing protein [Enterobacter cloacae]|uniref:DUF551 domain-containing protein n=1 Tax=Enterobacter cloacae TaxID=550 RepID=UPI0030176086